MAAPGEDDLLLTAFLDGELPPGDRDAIAARLEQEPELRARLEELRQGGVLVQSALAASLAAAPRANLAAKLALISKRRRSWRMPLDWRRAAVVAALAFAAGMAASRIPLGAPAAEDWRQSVAEYMALYTPASFPPRDEATLRADLSLLSQSVGVDLSEAKLRDGALSPRGGVLLQFQGSPLAQIGYVVDGAATAFCIIRDGEPDAAPAAARLGGFNAVSWAKAGRGFMVVSAAPADRLEELARFLHDRTEAE